MDLPRKGAHRLKLGLFRPSCTRLITESHAFGKLFRPLASERFGDEAVLSLLNGGALPFQVSLCRIMQNTHQEVSL